MIRRHQTLSELKCSSVLQAHLQLPHVVRCRVSRIEVERAVDRVLASGGVAYISGRPLWSGTDPQQIVGRDCFEVLFGQMDAALAFADAVAGVLTPRPFDRDEITPAAYRDICAKAGSLLPVDEALALADGSETTPAIFPCRHEKEPVMATDSSSSTPAPDAGAVTAKAMGTNHWAVDRVAWATEKLASQRVAAMVAALREAEIMSHHAGQAGIDWRRQFGALLDTLAADQDEQQEVGGTVVRP